MPIDQAVIDRFVDDYPTELPLTYAQRGWLMRVKAAHALRNSVRYGELGILRQEVILLCSEP
jgi:hypothetical protein